MTVRIKIADTYRREVEMEVPGSGIKPEKAKFIAVLRDVDPFQLQSDRDQLHKAMDMVRRMISAAASGDTAAMAELQQEMAALNDLTPKIDRYLVGVEQLQVIGHDDQPLSGDDLVEFVKRYPRARKAVMKVIEAEEGSDEPAALGNLLKSAGPLLGRVPSPGHASR